MTTLLDAWSSYLDERALELLQSAQEIADTQGIDANILHILFVAMTHTTLPIYQTLKAALGKETLQVLVTDIQEQMGSSALHFRLDMYKMACIEQAQRKQIQISDVLLLQQIFQKSYTIEQMARAHNISHEQVNTFLHQKVETQNEVPGIILSPQPYIARSETIDVPDIKQQVKKITCTPESVKQTVIEKIDDALHSITANSILINLARAIKEERLLILLGQNGSVTNWIDIVLAYRLRKSALQASHHVSHEEAEHDNHTALSGYALWKISLNNLRTLYSRKRHLHPALVLDYLKQEAVKESAILFISGLETLSRRSAVDRKIIEQLARPNGASILGFYLYYDNRPSKEVWQLGLDDTMVTLAEAEKFDDRPKLLSLIQRYHQPRWNAQGYVLDEHAFDSLFLLEPGIWIDKRRKTFPYLAVDLADDSIFTVERGEQHVHNLAEDAQLAIEDIITKESKHVEEATRSRYLDVLKAAHQRIGDLLHSPCIQYMQEKAVITQALIEAQLFCRNNSEFHFPGVLPWPAPHRYS